MPNDTKNDIATGLLALFLLFLIALMAFLNGCAPHHAVVKAPTEVNHEAFSYKCQGDVTKQTCLVWLKDGNEAAAKEEICTRSYVCAEAPAGRIVYIERTRK